MITRDDLTRALVESRVSDWVLTERRQELALVDGAAALRRREERTRWTLVVHSDQTGGRGSARVTIDAQAGHARAAVDQAIALATAAIGPAWQTAPLAAPAKVRLADPELAAADLGATASALLDAARASAAAGVVATGQVSILREVVAVESRGGLHARWDATLLAAELLVSAAGRSVAIGRSARRGADLGLPSAIAEAAADLRALAAAAAPAPGACDVVLATDALLHGGGLGVWAVFAAQADAVVERQGLTRYRVGGPVAPGAETAPEPLAITSDGALDLRVDSAPMGDDGDAVRRFALVERGVAAGLALGPREAALRGVDPNGGVRNLVVAPGAWRGPASAARVLEVRRLRGLAVDPYTGEASLEIALALETAGGATRAVTGGTLRLDLVAALARARRSADTVRRGPYEGPAAVWIADAELVP